MHTIITSAHKGTVSALDKCNYRKILGFLEWLRRAVAYYPIDHKEKVKKEFVFCD